MEIKTSKLLLAEIGKRVQSELEFHVKRLLENAFDDLAMDDYTVVRKDSSVYAHIFRKDGAPFIYVTCASVLDEGGSITEIVNALSAGEAGENAIASEIPFFEFFRELDAEGDSKEDECALYSECIAILQAKLENAKNGKRYR